MKGRLILAGLLLLACAEAPSPVGPALSETAQAECRGPQTVDPSAVTWLADIWLWKWQDYRGSNGHSEILLPATGRTRWLLAAELTNWGTVAIRTPFLRVATPADPVSGVVVVGDDVSPTATLAAGSATLWADGAGVPIPAGWSLNVFVPPLPTGANLAVTLFWYECL